VGEPQYRTGRDLPVHAVGEVRAPSRVDVWRAGDGQLSRTRCRPSRRASFENQCSIVALWCMCGRPLGCKRKDEKSDGRVDRDHVSGLSTRRHDRWPRWGPRSSPICGRPPPRKVFCSVLIRSLASICPTCWCARTWTLAKMVSATRVPNKQAT